MNYIKPKFILILATILIFTACKKDEEEEEQNQETTTPVSLLCGGDGSQRFFPLEIGYKWEEETLFSTIVNSEVIGTEEENGFTYFEVESTEYISGEAWSTWSRFYRVDEDGAVYRKFSEDEEYMLLPADPQLNDSWPYHDGFGVPGEKRVVSLSYTYENTDCSGGYQNCLQIALYNDKNEFLSFEYYFRGIGQVDHELLLFETE